MKKMLLVLAMLLLVASPAMAFDLGGYTGEIVFKYDNWDVGTLYPANTSATYTHGASVPGDGDADSFALLKMTSIVDLDANVLWFQGKDGEYMEGWVYGIDDWVVDLDAFGSGTIDSVGGKVELYLHTVNDLAMGTAPPSVPMSGLSAPTDNWNATNGTQFLALDIVPGINSLLGDMTTTYSQDIVTITNPTVGDGYGYLSVTGGAYAGMFDTNGYSSIYPGADFFLQLQFDSMDLSSSASSAGWLVKSDGTATGEIVPEPASMILMGIGLAGAALRRRKRMA